MNNKEKIVREIYGKYKLAEKRGIVADYIPELKNANIKDLSISILELDGNEINVGDYNNLFTMQSISKIISLTVAIMDNGLEFVMDKIGLKGSVDAFNSMYRLDFDNILKPDNPMINAGAILTTSLIKGTYDEKFNKILNFIKIISENKDISYDKKVYLSEKSTGYKNKSIGYLLKSKGMLYGEVDKILDVYFKQCSILLSTKDLAKIGRFYAGHGVLNGDHLCSKDIIKTVNSVMLVSGMYNYSGEYAAMVGIPSKSGVAGGILGVVPNVGGISVYSPGLDEYGNSFIGYKVMKELSLKFDYNIF